MGVKTEKRLLYEAEYRRKNRDKRNKQSQERRLRFRNLVFSHYGRKCSVCGYDDLRALQLDHIEDNGAEHQKSLGGQNFSGWRMYEWIVKNDFPEGFQVLCANHNMIKQWDKTH